MSRSVASELARGVAEGTFSTSASMLAAVGKTGARFREILLKSVYRAGANIFMGSETGKKKEKDAGATGCSLIPAQRS